jgi:hypothetical protein
MSRLFWWIGFFLAVPAFGLSFIATILQGFIILLCLHLMGIDKSPDGRWRRFLTIADCVFVSVLLIASGVGAWFLANYINTKFGGAHGTAIHIGLVVGLLAACEHGYAIVNGVYSIGSRINNSTSTQRNPSSSPTKPSNLNDIIGGIE